MSECQFKRIKRRPLKFSLAYTIHRSIYNMLVVYLDKDHDGHKQYTNCFCDTDSLIITVLHVTIYIFLIKDM